MILFSVPFGYGDSSFGSGIGDNSLKRASLRKFSLPLQRKRQNIFDFQFLNLPDQYFVNIPCISIALSYSLPRPFSTSRRRSQSERCRLARDIAAESRERHTGVSIWDRTPRFFLRAALGDSPSPRNPLSVVRRNARDSSDASRRSTEASGSRTCSESTPTASLAKATSSRRHPCRSRRRRRGSCSIASAANAAGARVE